MSEREAPQYICIECGWTCDSEERAERHETEDYFGGGEDHEMAIHPEHQ